MGCCTCAISVMVGIGSASEDLRFVDGVVVDGRRIATL